MDVGVLMCMGDGTPYHANSAACALVVGQAAGDYLSALLALLPAEALASARRTGRWYGEVTLDDARVVQVHAYHHGSNGRGQFMVVFIDVTETHAREQEQQRRHEESQQTLARLAGAQEQLLQAEKMASIGQLAAGVAHEINNPIGYVHSNLGTLQEYLHGLFAVIEAYERALRAPDPRALQAEIDDMRSRFDLDFIRSDLPQLMAESREGIERVTEIVRNLKDFSYSDRDESWRLADLHAGLDSTISIIWNELKYKVTLEKDYGALPLVQCLPSELNQVFMNILLNASHAIAERGRVTVATGVRDDQVWISIEDTGVGIPEDVQQRIFDPFYTTKPVGKGTGLGLSISYRIVRKHGGNIEVSSSPGNGACFRITLPIRQPDKSLA
ncbi:ATP-binding protein [Luteimonas cucumeris]|nr:ATP-binding protein [Luteimonas cucumeris]